MNKYIVGHFFISPKLKELMPFEHFSFWIINDSDIFGWKWANFRSFSIEKCSNDINSFNFGDMKKFPCLNLVTLIYRIQIFCFGERARISARGARSLNQPKKWKFWIFSKKSIFCLALRARASARAKIWCTPMHSPDSRDNFWLLDCYSS